MPGDARLEGLRRQYQREVTEAVARLGRPVRVTPYVLAAPGAERQADLDLIGAHVHRLGWQITRSSFADIGQAPPIEDRTGFGEACRYAAQGFAHGIVAISRAAITTHNDTYAHLLDELHRRRVFLAYLPAEPGRPLTNPPPGGTRLWHGGPPEITSNEGDAP
ncbi:hypothetical protein [Streptomyces sp. NBC_00268]|uniref:hypothetical protein n=1 Tax=Streptomyces sp. NBC_00268 TaxID=2975695 RepID=UPI00224DA68A|nr:hypothetical protein [Streptomyces sp. NBC_00268]MCX5182628.1 hypothetical protein [Streptomyces sp. NBC_00268]